MISENERAPRNSFRALIPNLRVPVPQKLTLTPTVTIDPTGFFVLLSPMLSVRPGRDGYGTGGCASARLASQPASVAVLCRQPWKSL
jgi:hypothetical protein